MVYFFILGIVFAVVRYMFNQGIYAAAVAAVVAIVIVYIIKSTKEAEKRQQEQAYYKEMEHKKEEERKKAAAEQAAKEAREAEEIQRAFEARQARRNEYQYTYEGIQQRGHYSLIDYSGRSDKAQDWIATLGVGQEVEVSVPLDKEEYMIDEAVLAPQRMVDIMLHKEVCRFYVHKIEETPAGKLSVQFIAAYDVNDPNVQAWVERVQGK